MYSKTIEIYLPDGESASVRVAEVKNRTIQLVVFPRSKLSSNLGIDRAGVYFLFGNDDEMGGRPLVYIGQAKDCLSRIKHHYQDSNKDYWNVAAVFVTKDQSFGTTEIEYLEQMAVNQAKVAGKYLVKNEVVPPSSSLSPSQKSQMEEIFGYFELLLSVVNYPVFSPPVTPTDTSDLFYCEGSSIKAWAKYTDAGMVVLKMSQMRKEVTPTLSKGIVLLRETLVNQGYVSEGDDSYTFLSDYP